MMMIFRRIVVTLYVVVVLVSLEANGQTQPSQQQTRGYGAEYYCSPVDFLIRLAGNVGEIRGSHFHAGLDIKATQGVGSPVYAVADGYVSRVGVSPTGYGHVLYVIHPNGETSVYGHLDKFEPQIARWVREQQYAKRSFRVNLYPVKGQFMVNKGHRIASLGNTGSSGGPHLHLEIRDVQGRPRNLIAEGVFKVADRVPPQVTRLLLYEVSSALGVPYRRLKQSVAVRTLPDGSTVLGDTILKLGQSGYLAYEVIDFKDGRSNTMGVYGMEQRVDGDLNFSFAIDRLSYATTSYVGAFVDYAENRKAKRTSVIRAYVSPNNKLAFYGSERKVTDGIIEAGDTPQRVETVVMDDAGNQTVLRFCIERETDIRANISDIVPQGKAVSWWAGATFELPGAEVTIPQGALYESMILSAEMDTVAGGTEVLRVGTGDVPLQKAITIRLLPSEELEERLRSKALLVMVDTTSGKVSSVGGVWSASAQRVEVDVKRMGCFAVAVDTIAPKITPVYASGATVPKGQTLRWVVEDDLSGISSYALTVDGKWELLASDPKSRTMEHTPLRGATPAKHAVVMTVRDAKGNTRTFKGSYIW